MRIVYAYENVEQSMNIHRTKDKQRRKSVNVSVRADVVAEAKKLKLNLSDITENALLEAVGKAGFEKWKHDNAKSIERYNNRVAKHGVFSDGLRRF
jgi:antitoxin CcdA